MAAKILGRTVSVTFEIVKGTKGSPDVVRETPIAYRDPSRRFGISEKSESVVTVCGSAIGQRKTGERDAWQRS